MMGANEATCSANGKSRKSCSGFQHSIIRNCLTYEVQWEFSLWDPILPARLSADDVLNMLGEQFAPNKFWEKSVISEEQQNA